jgi:hypothetical protein
MYRSR